MNNPETVEDKRSTIQPARKELESKLSREQLISLRRMEALGWSLQFIRKPLFQDAVPIILEGNGKRIGVLEVDGRLNCNVDIEFRGDIEIRDVDIEILKNA